MKKNNICLLLTSILLLAFAGVAFADTPSISSFLINSTSAGYANDANVRLTVSVSGDVNAMRFSCNNSTWSTYETYSSTKYFDINSGSYGCAAAVGSRTVYAQVRDTNLDASSVVNNTIILDLEAPSVDTFSPSSDVTNGNGANGQAISIGVSDDYNISYISIKLVRGTTTVYDYNSTKCTITGTSATCSFTDLKVDRGGSYTYHLSLHDRAGNYDTNTNVFSFTDSTAPSAPSKPTGYDTNTTVYLRWTALTTNDLNRYGVYKSTQTGFDTNTETFVDYADTNYYNATGLDENTTYYFKITAFDFTGNESSDSDENSYTTDFNYGFAPTITRTDTSCDSNEWCHHREADFSFSVTNAKYSWLWTTNSTTNPSDCNYYSDCNTASSVSVSSIPDGTSYFKVKSCKPTGCSSTGTFILKIDTNSPSAPGNVAVSNSGYSNVLTWTASSDGSGSGVYRYYIYRSEKSTFYGSTGQQVGYVDSNVRTYTDASTIKGKTYYYRVRAMDAAANYSSELNVSPVSSKVPEAGEETIIYLTTTDTSGKDINFYNSAKDLNVLIIFSKMVDDVNIQFKKKDQNTEIVLRNSDDVNSYSFIVTSSVSYSDINIFVEATSTAGKIYRVKVIERDLNNPKIGFVNIVDGNLIEGKKNILMDANDNKKVERISVFINDKNVGNAQKDKNYWKFSFDPKKHASGVISARVVDGAGNSAREDLNIVGVVVADANDSNTESVKATISDIYAKKSEIEKKIALDPNYLSADLLLKKQEADALLVEAEQLFLKNPTAANEKALLAQQKYLEIVNSKNPLGTDLTFILLGLSAVLIIIGAIAAAIFVKGKKGPGKKIPPYFDEELLIKKA